MARCQWSWKMRASMMVLSAVALVAFGGTALAQVQQNPAKPNKARSAGSMECSKQADAKGLHGKARKHFRSKCMKELGKQTASSK
jgi:hypothetical protein